MKVERILVINPTQVQREAEQKINLAQEEIVSAIRAIIQQALNDYLASLTARSDYQEIIANIRHCAQAFFAKHLQEEVNLDALPERTRQLVIQLANHSIVGLDAYPGVFGFLGALALAEPERNVRANKLFDLFVKHSIPPAQKIVEELERHYPRKDSEERIKPNSKKEELSFSEKLSESR
ncbi:hypothetical protein [Candidatus Protochlamydia phocaeensis]|uniref:hypothetical protein n=1 Tax=Candidatus Protochlamydia phocaeensis TaxID=1414722 RepID=UPI000837E1E5|nr:hypothetical protein [Candidatus Protochlamydia phocaeensis]